MVLPTWASKLDLRDTLAPAPPVRTFHPKIPEPVPLLLGGSHRRKEEGGGLEGRITRCRTRGPGRRGGGTGAEQHDVAHTDSFVLSVINQEDAVSGLHVLHGGAWRDVVSAGAGKAGTLHINLGNMARAISGDVYCKMCHRVALETRRTT